MENKLVPSLWFCATPGDITDIITYYKTVFGNSFESSNIMDLGETPSGKTQLAEVKIFGQKFSLMNTEKEHAPFNDAFSLTVLCEDQTEIDLFWNYFTKEGREVQCGWCIDKYGFRWQVIPKNMKELMGRENSWKVMMSQKKIVISEYN